MTVKNWREKLESSGEVQQINTRTVTRNGTTYQQNTANIGKRNPEPSFDGGTRVVINRTPE